MSPSESSSSDQFSFIEDAETFQRVSASISEKTREEESDYQNEHTAWLTEELASAVQDRGERKKFSKLIFSLACGWLISVWLLLFWQGFGSKIGFFSLSDNVLSILIGATSLKVLGLMFLVTKYLFSERRLESRRHRSGAASHIGRRQR